MVVVEFAGARMRINRIPSLDGRSFYSIEIKSTWPAITAQTQTIFLSVEQMQVLREAINKVIVENPKWHLPLMQGSEEQ
jgi:hypothetical protein